MKKILFILMTTSVFAQAPNLVEVEEYTARNQKKMVLLLQSWAQVEREITGNNTFVLEVIDGNKVYYCRGFDGMKQLVEDRNKRWGSDGTRAKIMKKWQSESPYGQEEGAWFSTDPNRVANHIFWLNKRFSYVPEGIKLSEVLPTLKFRRHVMIDVNSGPESRQKFQEQIILGIENDKKLKNNYIRFMYSPWYGGPDNVDFMMIVLDESREKYFEGLAERKKKRGSDDDWKSIQSENMANWIDEEHFTIHY